MRRALLFLFAGCFLAATAGCCSDRAGGDRPAHDLLGFGKGTCQAAPETCAGCDTCGDPQCRNCYGRGCEHCLGHNQPITPGPPVGAVTYPYYTTRGPRDFLASNPTPIGP